jgi:leucyl aminopeptidase (aminopeptidase T)
LPVLATIALLAAGSAGSQSLPQHTMDWPGIAAAIVKRLSLEQGEKVIIVAHPDKFSELVPHLRHSIMAAGGIDLGVIQVPAHPYPETWRPAQVFENRQAAHDSYVDMLKDVDAGIMMPGANPAHAVYRAMQTLLMESRGPRRTIHFHWTDAYSPSSDTTGLTGINVMPGHPPPPLHVVDRLYQNAVIHSDDASISAHQARFSDALAGATIRVTTPAGTDISFRTGDRDIILQNGDASAARMRSGAPFLDREIEIPPGAVRMAPVEESVSGTVVYPYSAWNGETVIGARIEYVAGEIVSITAAAGAEHVNAELAGAGKESRRFREFALGFNPLLSFDAARRAWIPYFGYGAGIVRLGIGNNAQLGGAVTGRYFRWRDLITDASVSIDGVPWVVDGNFVK